MRLVEWGEGDQALELLHHRLVDAHRRTVKRSAVHHAMAHGGEASDAAVIAEPNPDPCDGSAMIAGLRRGKGLVGPYLAARVGDDQARWGLTDALDLPLEERTQLSVAFVALEERKLEARGSGVQDENRTAHPGILVDARANGSQETAGASSLSLAGDRPGASAGSVWRTARSPW